MVERLSAPAICAFGDNIYLALRNPISNAIVVHEIGGATTVLPGQFTADATALVSFQNKLVLAYKGLTNGKLYVTTSRDGLEWSYQALPATDTLARVALCASSDGLHLAYTDATTAQVRTMMTRDGVTWFGPGATSISTIDGPALAFCDGIFVLLYQASGPGRDLACATSADGIDWMSPTNVPRQGTPLSPCVIVDGATVRSTYQGIESDHIYATSASFTDGTLTWNAYHRLDQRTLTSPSVTRIGSDLFMAYTDPSDTVQVAISPDGGDWMTIAIDLPADLGMATPKLV